MGIKKYSILVLFLLFALDQHAQSHCHSVQLKIYPTSFLSVQKDGGGIKKGRRTMSMAFNVRYTIYKKGHAGQSDTILFSTSDECYTKKNTHNSIFPLALMTKKVDPFYATLCFENGVDLSNYYISITSRAWGWNQVQKSKNTPYCDGGGSDNSTVFNFFDENLSDLNTNSFKKIKIKKDGNHSSSFGFVTRVEKKEIPYPQYSIPDEITVCKNQVPFVFDIEKYTYNLKMRYFKERTTTISKYDATSNTWNVYNGYEDDTVTKFSFNHTDDLSPTFEGGRYAVTTTLNNDCEMTDTFNLTFIDTAVVATPVPPVICQNGTGTIEIPVQPSDSNNISYLWMDQFGNCLWRYRNLPVEDTGTYTVKVTRNNGCYSRLTAQVDFKNNAVVKFEHPEIFSCFSTPNQFSIEPEGTFERFKWSTGIYDTLSSITINRPGTYKVTATDEDHCVSTAAVTVVDTCLMPIHSDILSHYWIAKIDKIDFDDPAKNAIRIVDPRSLAGSVPYNEDDIIKRKSFVRLQYHRSQLSDFKDSIWTLSVPYQITVDNNPPVSRTLFLNKTNGGQDIYQTVFEHEGGNQIVVKINHSAIAILDRNGNPLTLVDIPNDINLEVELQTMQVPKFVVGSGGTAIDDNSLVHVIDNTNKKIKIVWDAIEPAIEYELQVAFIDALDKNNTVNDELFKSKGWSIVTADNTYTLDATYPQGTFVYRVRPYGRQTVGVGDNYNHVAIGNWSDAKQIEIGETEELEPFEQERNWSKVVTFAEEGKKKEVISYMDGTYRTRQVLTNLNTEKLTLAAETFYDNESRGTLNVLPVPLEDNNLTFKTDLNVSTTGPIDKEFVDSEIQQPLDASSGASKYYSTNNPFISNTDVTNKVNISAIPKADGFVTTKVEYSRDNTGRVVKQSGVGSEFAIRDTGEHYTQYFYATPTATELQRLFGSNVGRAVYYSKNMVVDPNGQVSVNYLDNDDKTIATALAGDSPPNLLSLDTLDKPTPVEFPFNLSENNIRDSVNKLSTSVNIITNDVVNKNYTFHYNVNANKDSATVDSMPYCKDCRYRLEISITDPNGNAVTLTDPDEGIVAPFYINETADAIEGVLDTGLCNNPDFAYPELIFNAEFAKLGNYTFTKKLTLLDDDELSIDDYLAQIGFPTLDSFIAQNIGNYIDSLACRDDCPSRLAVYIRDVRREDSLNGGGVRSEVIYDAIKDSLVAAGYCDPFLAAQFDAVEYANRHCDELLKNIIRQISPGEKFFNRTGMRIRTAGSPEKDSLIAWGIYVISANTNEQIAARWVDGWGAKIINLFKGRLHPEYCHYENCVSDTNNNAFDIKMGLMSGFTEALNKGYITATGSAAANNREYEFGPTIQAEIDAMSVLGLGVDLQGALDEYIDLTASTGHPGYLLKVPVDIMGNRIRKINVIEAVRPRTVYWRPDYITPAIADSGYNTARLYYPDSMSYDINSNGIIDTPEWDSAFWIHFSAAFLATKKKALALKHEAEGCGYLNDGDALVKNMNMSALPGGQAHALALSYNTQSAYCATCPDKAIVLADKLARECRAIRAKFAADPPFRQIVIDSIRNYCMRSCGQMNPLAIITHNAILNGDLNAIRDYIQDSIPGADTCNILDILDSGVKYNYSTDSTGSIIISYVCDDNPCSIASIIDIANHYDFNYPKIESLIFREGFDSGPSTVYYADSIYKQVQSNGVILNTPSSRTWTNMEITNYAAQLSNPITALYAFVCGWGSVSDFTNGLHYLDQFKDATNDSMGYYMLNGTLAGSNFNGVFWQNAAPIPVTYGNTYLLSYYLANITWGNINIVPVMISKSSDSVYVDTLFTQREDISCAAVWNRYNYYWSPREGVDSVTISMFNRESNSWGNDFAFDEIKLELVVDTIKPNLACPSVRDNKYLITPGEITASYAACNNSNEGGGIYTLFFVDSFGNRINNVARLENRRFELSTPVTPLQIYNLKSVQFAGYSANALLTDSQYIKIFIYEASCALPSWNFVNDNSNCPNDGDLSDLNDLRNDYLNSNSNYACNRSFDSCTLRPTAQVIPPDSIPCDSSYDCLNMQWTPDTSFQACINRQINAQQGWLTQMYNDSLAKILTAYQNTHIANCFKNLNEDFYYRTTINEYHYTLYYYDQNKNLVQTIPPAGVYPVPSSGFTASGMWLGGAENEPRHVLKTRYQYNTRKQPVAQHSPDGGVSSYWYNKKGMLLLSQNEKQKAGNRFSFTRYDALGRIVLVGELLTPDNFAYNPAATLESDLPDLTYTDTINRVIQDPLFPLNYLDAEDYELTNLTQTEYDEPSFLPGINQSNLHNRVSATYAYDTYEKLLAGEGIATIYSYDEVGNVKTVVQDLSQDPDLAELEQNADADHLRKTVDYDYDLVSGKVNAVVYNNGKQDQFGYRYAYDADNRITDVYSSTDGVIEQHDAKYFYYPHGPLAAVEIGNDKVQAAEYGYTLQGWLKYIANRSGNSLNSYIPAYQADHRLGYYKDDYKSIGGSNSDPTVYPGSSSFYGSITNPKYLGLYNGNIAYSQNQLSGLMKDTLLYKHRDATYSLTEYVYDQLNRIMSSNTLTIPLPGFGPPDVAPEDKVLLNAYKSNYSYDPNGNINTLSRYAPDMISKQIMQMDSFNYAYAKTDDNDLLKLYNNRLFHVNDLQTDGGLFDGDMDDQGVLDAPGSVSSGTQVNQLGNSNYTYDDIGQLIADQSEHIDAIAWTPYGKIASITYNILKPTIRFKYDASGNRVAKILTKADKSADSIVTYYYRDAQGNPLDIVIPKLSGSIYSEEHSYNLYGSSRLGMLNHTYYLGSSALMPYAQTRGERTYELTDHLSNVLTTVTDKKYAMLNESSQIYYEPSIASVTDYYPFGMQMPLRTLPIKYDIELPCTIFDSTEYSIVLEQTYNNTIVPWQNIMNMDITPTPLGIDANVAGSDVPAIMFQENAFSNLRDHRYKITYTVDSLSADWVALFIGGSNECEIDFPNQILVAPFINGTHSFEFMGTGTSHTAVALITEDTTAFFQLQYLKIEEKILTPACSTEVVLDENYATNDESAWNPISGNSTIFIAADKLTSSGGTNFASSELEVNVGMYTSLNTQPGYHYTVALEGVETTMPDGASYVLFNSMDDLGNGIFLTEGPLLSCYTGKYIEFTATNTTTYLGLGNTLVSDGSTDVSGNVSIGKIRIVGWNDANRTTRYVTMDGMRDYRFGFNGMEKDDEVKGSGNSINYQARMQDTRLGRFLSIDPLADDYPWYSPYQFAGNTPIQAIDMDGAEPLFFGSNPAWLRLGPLLESPATKSIPRIGPIQELATKSELTKPQWNPQNSFWRNLNEFFRYGREVHKEQFVRWAQEGFKTEQGLGKFGRADGLKWEQIANSALKRLTIRELKPNNAFGRQAGYEQLMRYAEGAIAKYGGEIGEISLELELYGAVGAFYNVEAGDNISSIAKKHGVTVNQIQQLNSLDSKSTIHPGDNLLINIGSKGKKSNPNTSPSDNTNNLAPSEYDIIMRENLPNSKDKTYDCPTCL